MPSRRVVRPAGRGYYNRPTPSPKNRQNLNWSALGWMRYIIIGGLAAFGAWAVFSIQAIKVEGNRFIDSASVVRLAEASFSHHPFSRNLFTIGAARIETELPAADKRLRTVEVKRQWPNNVLLVVEERQPALAWKSGEQTYVIDDSGVTMGSLSQIGLTLPLVTDSTNLPVKAGDRLVPASFVKFCQDLIELVPKKTGLQITGLRIHETTSELAAVTNRNFYIKFDTTRPADGEVADLQAVMDTLNKQKKTPTEYVDLRIAGKAYYK
jgi:cell division septal protein FtsQ